MQDASVRWAQLQAGLSCCTCCMSCGAVLLLSCMSRGSLIKAGSLCRADTDSGRAGHSATMACQQDC